MNKVVQGLLYGAFAICVGYFSVAPTYHYADPGVATIRVSLSHAANRVEECVKLTPQQINERATQGLALNECARERQPVTVELEIDGARVLLVTAAPSGFWNDGPASVYERLDIAPGTHTITARLRDSARQQGWDYEHSESVTLSPGRYFTISFRAETGGFGFR
jgi:hypothetical protein